MPCRHVRPLGPVCRCVLGANPRKLSPQDANTLTNLAELVVRQLEKDHLLELQRLVRTARHRPEDLRVLKPYFENCINDLLTNLAELVVRQLEEDHLVELQRLVRTAGLTRKCGA